MEPISNYPGVAESRQARWDFCPAERAFDWPLKTWLAVQIF